MPKTINKTEKKRRLAYLKKRAGHWQEYFGLSIYSFKFFDSEDPDIRAMVYFDTANKLCLFMYQEDWLYDPDTDDEEISKTAFHEMAEVFLDNTRIFMGRAMSEPLVDGEIHKTIRFLENKLFPLVN